MAKNTTEEVIEKRESSPVTMACLIIAAVAIVGAMVLQVIEIAEYRSGTGPKVATTQVQNDLRQFDSSYDDLLSASAGGSDEFGEEDPDDLGVDLDNDMDDMMDDEPLDDEPLEDDFDEEEI